MPMCHTHFVKLPFGKFVGKNHDGNVTAIISTANWPEWMVKWNSGKIERKKIRDVQGRNDGSS